MSVRGQSLDPLPSIESLQLILGLSLFNSAAKEDALLDFGCRQFVGFVLNQHSQLYWGDRGSKFDWCPGGIVDRPMRYSATFEAKEAVSCW